MVRQNLEKQELEEERKKEGEKKTYTNILKN
jgi:hypothetical protein